MNSCDLRTFGDATTARRILLSVPFIAASIFLFLSKILGDSDSCHLFASLCPLSRHSDEELCSPASFTAPLWVYKIEIHAWVLAGMTKMASEKNWNSAIHLELRALMSPHRAMHEMKMASRERFLENHISQSTSVRILGLFFIWRGLNSGTLHSELQN